MKTKTTRLGRIAATLPRAAIAPVRSRSLRIAAEAFFPPPVRIDPILVPVDFSDCSRTALQFAVSVARTLKASLILLYVAETHPAGSELGPCHLPDLEADLRRMAKNELSELTKHEVPAEPAPRTLIRAGRAD